MNHSERGNAADQAGASLVARAVLNELMKAPRFHYDVECIGADGVLKWAESFDNLVTTGGKDDLLDKYFAGSAYTAAWYLGLKGTGTAAAGDTMASHATWSEVNPYTGNRPALSWSAASAGSKAATVVSYSITSSATVAGAFTATSNTGTTGILYSAGDFGTSRSVVSGDTLNVTLTLSV